MNILLLGNGFDLYYKLPTSYRNFLLTLDFLINTDVSNINNISDVFGNPMLNEQDDFIKKSYDEYKEVYDEIELDKEKLQEMIDKTKNNVWFSYLITVFNKDVGWIDFEREIAYVIHCFKYFFKNLYKPFEAKKNVSFIPSNSVFKYEESKYIITEKFNFFIDNESRSKDGKDKKDIIIKKDFTCECPLKPGYFRIDKGMIIDYLYNQFQDLVEALKIYLYLFIDKTTELLCASPADKSRKQPKISLLDFMKYNDAVISFNYTYTYEWLSPKVDTFHIHGEIDKEIVLGINSDNDDKQETVDTSFLMFKKYYQCTYNETYFRYLDFKKSCQHTDYYTDISYPRWFRWLREKIGPYDIGAISEKIDLLVMGHSLDVTDEKYIRELFGLATNITVLYHDETAKKQYIKNLVNIFGGDEFEKLRDEKELEFLNLQSDLSVLCFKREKNYMKLNY